MQNDSNKIMVLFFLSCLLFSFRLEGNDEKVLLCGVCKNVSKSLDNTIRNLEELGSHFRDYEVIIYENNSVDDTPLKLTEWAQKNPHVVLMTETLPEAQVKVCRTQRIANARNKVLEVARQEKYQDYTYLIMIDLDFPYPWPIKEIVNSLNAPFEWDCIAANGIYPDGMYRDSLAFRSIVHPFGPELLGEEFWTRRRENKFRLGNTWLQVYSAFCGLAIYKTKTITQFSYSGVVTDDLKEFYKRVVSELPSDNHHLLTYLRDNNLDNSDIPILFKKNTIRWQQKDDDSIACCEHVTLHASMTVRGYDKFYINPEIVMRY
jgi:glycosyltransferase involved in cell wall biosynthesis